MVFISSFCFVNNDYSLSIYKLSDDFAVELVHQLTAHREPVLGLLFHPSLHVLFSCGSEGVFAWDYLTGRCIAQWKPHSDMLFKATCLCFVPSCALLCVGAVDGTIFLFDTADGYRQSDGVNFSVKLVGSICAHRSVVNQIIHHESSSLLASTSRDHMIHLWRVSSSLSSLDLVCSFDKHVGNVLSLAFSPDGRFLFSGGSDNVVRLWDVRSERFVRNIETSR